MMDIDLEDFDWGDEAPELSAGVYGVIGPSNTGKSQVLLDLLLLPWATPALFVNSDAGQRTGARELALEDVTTVRVQGVEAMAAAVEGAKGRYRTVLLDGLTAALVQSKVESQRTTGRTKKGNKPGAHRHALNAHEHMPRLIEAMRECASAGLLVGYTALEREHYEGFGDERVALGTRPWMSAACADLLQSVSDCMWSLDLVPLRDGAPCADWTDFLMSGGSPKALDWRHRGQIAYTSPNESQPWAKTRGPLAFTSKIPHILHHPNLRRFLAAWVDFQYQDEE